MNRSLVLNWQVTYLILLLKSIDATVSFIQIIYPLALLVVEISFTVFLTHTMFRNLKSNVSRHLLSFRNLFFYCSLSSVKSHFLSFSVQLGVLLELSLSWVRCEIKGNCFWSSIFDRLSQYNESFAVSMVGNILLAKSNYIEISMFEIIPSDATCNY